MPMPQRPRSQARQLAELERFRRQEERRLDPASSTSSTSSGGGGGVLETVTASSDGATIEADLGVGLWAVSISGTASLDATGTQFQVHLTYTDPALGYSVINGDAPWADGMGTTTASAVTLTDQAGTYYVVTSGNYVTIDVPALNFTAHRIA